MARSLLEHHIETLRLRRNATPPSKSMLEQLQRWRDEQRRLHGLDDTDDRRDTGSFLVDSGEYESEEGLG